MMIEKIKQDLIQQKNLPELGWSLAPVSKYAFYNPAKKDKNGNIVVREPIPIIPLIKALTTTIIFFGMICKLIGAGLTIFGGIATSIGVLVYHSFFYHRDKIIVNKTGIALGDREYHWEDYSGAYLFFYRTKELLQIEIVLVYEEGKYVFVDISKVAAIRFSSVATAIRDCQPENYKNSPTFGA